MQKPPSTCTLFGSQQSALVLSETEQLFTLQDNYLEPVSFRHPSHFFLTLLYSVTIDVVSGEDNLQRYDLNYAVAMFGFELVRNVEFIKYKQRLKVRVRIVLLILFSCKLC